MRRFAVGGSRAVDVLTAKLRERFEDTPASCRLSKAIGRAHTRHRQVDASDDRAFFHGLLTGYAVTKKVLERKRETHA